MEDAKYARATIKWKDDSSICDYTIKLSCSYDSDEEDEQIFYYCNGIKDLEDLMDENGVKDFVVLDYELSNEL